MTRTPHESVETEDVIARMIRRDKAMEVNTALQEAERTVNNFFGQGLNAIIAGLRTLRRDWRPTTISEVPHIRFEAHTIDGGGKLIAGCVDGRDDIVIELSDQQTARLLNQLSLNKCLTNGLISEKEARHEMG